MEYTVEEECMLDIDVASDTESLPVEDVCSDNDTIISLEREAPPFEFKSDSPLLEHPDSVFETETRDTVNDSQTYTDKDQSKNQDPEVYTLNKDFSLTIDRSSSVYPIKPKEEIANEPTYIQLVLGSPLSSYDDIIFKNEEVEQHISAKVNGSPFKCPYCNKIFNGKGGLERHLRSHTQEKPYVCEICGKGFSQRGNCKVHQRVHTGEKKAHCKICNKWFNDNSVLANHQRTHSGDKPFQCEICGKRFSQNGNLAVHMRVHSRVKRYQCDICDKWFAHSGTLRRHYMFHEGNKTFECSTCGKKFLQEQDLTRHVRTHTGDRPFSCSLCNKTFALKGNLLKHLRTHERKLQRAKQRNQNEKYDTAKTLDGTTQKAKQKNPTGNYDTSLHPILSKEDIEGENSLVIVIETE